MYSKVKVMHFVHSSNVNHCQCIVAVQTGKWLGVGDITKYTDKIWNNIT